MKIYLDACYLNRPLDDQGQDRIRVEAEAVLAVISLTQGGRHQVLNSDALQLEVGNIRDADRREKIQDLLRLAGPYVRIGKQEWDQAEELEALGFSPLDALHLACAETGGADSLLTTDDRLLKRAARHHSKLRVHVANPAQWLLERQP
jgi:predicted nucleic acid-binding protein